MRQALQQRFYDARPITYHGLEKQLRRSQHALHGWKFKKLKEAPLEIVAGLESARLLNEKIQRLGEENNKCQS